MGILLACVSVYHVTAALRGHKRYQIPGTGVMDSCQLLQKCWGLDSSLEEQSALLTTEPSLQPINKY